MWKVTNCVDEESPDYQCEERNEKEQKVFNGDPKLFNKCFTECKGLNKFVIPAM